MSLNQGIDIIIPIYNAFDDLTKCIESILRHTNLSQNGLILINDASPDERIASYLDSLSAENITVIHNKKNLGFSGNINKGIELSNRDVLLLNSDTLVTVNWLEKIQFCAYSDPSIGTVTPLSNNATLCSVPVFCHENSLPEGFSLDDYAALIENVSLRKYPLLPVANGFCMFIKRCVIEDIGLFDSETFGRGYGEENDFCYRAEQAGYRHVMCDDTYIYHSGTGSFVSDEKRKYLEAHERILDKRFPAQMQAVRVHCRDNPNRDIFKNINLAVALENGRKNILYLVQADFRDDGMDNVGGTQLHVKDLCRGLCNEFNIFVAARNSNYLNLTVYIDSNEFFFQFYIGDPNGFPQFRNAEFKELYGKILDGFCIDLVHIHHTLDLSLELFYQAKKRRIPIVFTFHDYYYVCPTIKLLNHNNQFCTDICTESICKDCLKKREGIYPNIDFLKIWRREHLQVLEMADLLITPSNSAKKILGHYFPSLESKIQVIEHGSNPFPVTASGKVTKVSFSSFHVAFVGGISDAKGSYCASQLVKNSPHTIKWHLFGIYGHNDLSVIERANFIKTGKYSREELPELLNKYKIDLICILPIWPETFCYTISEAILYGIPVIATDIGALGERIRKMDCGWLVPYTATYKEVLDIINRIKDRGEEYQAKKRNALSATIRTVEEMCNDYRYLYQVADTSGKDIKLSQKAYKEFSKDYLFGSGKGNSRDPILQRLNDTEQRLWNIEHSSTYRITQVLMRIGIPFKKQLKALLFRIYKAIH
ncbi:MAG: glycosyltransferase [Lachnospiraceae bacterium]|jgi:GT2 family glycosyltransferase/glycosyltransferase involved in cell wall biosynthesis|nr:glycosyltransferase [Lachnospiraceae bacterium]